jgi:hypothetical protein
LVVEEQGVDCANELAIRPEHVRTFARLVPPVKALRSQKATGDGAAGSCERLRGAGLARLQAGALTKNKPSALREVRG